MRTIRAFRRRQLDVLARALERPNMYAGPEVCVEGFFWWLLEELCYIDEREGDFDAARERLGERGMMPNTGVYGLFRHHYLPHVRSVSYEVGSVYAEVAHQLGYLTPERLLSPSEMRALRRGLRRWIQGQRIITPADVLAKYGGPSLTMGGRWGAVLCYAPVPPMDGWVFFDHDDSLLNDGDDDPPLRDVRLPARSFARGLIETPYGRRLRAAHCEGVAESRKRG